MIISKFYCSSGKRGFNSNKKDNLRKDIIEKLMKMLDEVNPYVKKFRTARDRFHIAPEDSFHMRIVSDRSKDGRTYNTPTASEVVVLIPGDFNLDMHKRDIVLQQKSGNLLRINENMLLILPFNILCYLLMEKMDSDLVLRKV